MPVLHGPLDDWVVEQTVAERRIRAALEALEGELGNVVGRAVRGRVLDRCFTNGRGHRVEVAVELRVRLDQACRAWRVSELLAPRDSAPAKPKPLKRVPSRYASVCDTLAGVPEV